MANPGRLDQLVGEDHLTELGHGDGPTDQHVCRACVIALKVSCRVELPPSKGVSVASGDEDVEDVQDVEDVEQPQAYLGGRATSNGP